MIKIDHEVKTVNGVEASNMYVLSLYTTPGTAGTTHFVTSMTLEKEEAKSLRDQLIALNLTTD